MKGMVRDVNSGALLRVPTPEEIVLEKLAKKVDAIYAVLTDTQRKKIDKELSENG